MDADPSHFDDFGVVLLESEAAGDVRLPLTDNRRLTVLDELEILDVPLERNFQMLAELATSVLNIPVALITLVTDKRQFFVSSMGLSEPWASLRETPLSHSFCQHVVKRSEPLIVCDARKHPLVHDNLAIRDLNVVAYLGIPLVVGGSVVGSFCLIDDRPRAWTKGELLIATKMAHLTVSELMVRQEENQKQLELESSLRQAQKMEAIGQLASGVAHDFNSVLWAIQIFTELLQRESSVESQAMSHVNNIKTAIDSAKGIIQQLLNWSRPEHAEKTQISLTQIVMDFMPLLKSGLRDSVDIVHQTNDEGYIFADIYQIYQVLLNLCNNAEHAMRNTGGLIVISIDTMEITDDDSSKPVLPSGKYVKLAVVDSGCGISPEIVHRVHDPYFTTKPVGEGTGLGLWTVFGIARAHDAQVKVKSVVGEGTKIEIFFPWSHSVDEDIQRLTGSALSTKSSGARVLIVDNEPMVADGLQRLLTSEGYQVVCFTNSLTAIEYFLDDPSTVDIMIVDHTMPDISGAEFIRQIRSVRPALPVVVCSARLSNIDDETLTAIGADAYCPKPHAFRDLCATIDRLIAKASCP